MQMIVVVATSLNEPTRLSHHDISVDVQTTFAPALSYIKLSSFVSFTSERAEMAKGQTPLRYPGRRRGRRPGFRPVADRFDISRHVQIARTCLRLGSLPGLPRELVRQLVCDRLGDY